MEETVQAAPHLPKLLRAHTDCCQLAHALLTLGEREQEALGICDENSALVLLAAVLQVSGDAHMALPTPSLVGDHTPELEQWDRCVQCKRPAGT